MGNEVKSSQEFDLQTLDVLLDAVANQATQPGLDRKDFYASTNQKLLAGTGSLASIVWVGNAQGQIRLAGQSGWTSLDEPQKNAVQKFVKKQLAPNSQPQNIAQLPFGTAYCDLGKPGNGFRFLYLLLREPGDSPLVKQVFRDLVAEVSGQIEIFENARTAERPDPAARDLTQLAQLLQNAGKASSLKQLAFHLVNDLSKITKADRVTYLSNSGKIQAISGAAAISHRTSIVRSLTRLGKATLKSRASIEWLDEEINFDGNRQPRNIAALIKETGTMQGYVLPCENDGKLYGALILEFFGDADSSIESANSPNSANSANSANSMDPVERRQLINEVIEFASPVIARSNQVHSIPAIGLQNVFFNRILNSPARLVAWSLAAAAILCFAWFGLVAIERPFEIYGQGLLEPIQKQHVFAQTDGEVKDLLVEENSTVAIDQPLLVIESRTLEKELIEVEGEIAEVQQQLRNYALTEIDGEVDDVLDAETRRASEVARLQIRLDALQSRLAFFEERQSKQNIMAPLAGVVITPDLRRRLVDRPINRGDLLMSIAQTSGEWQIKLQIPENRVQFIESAIAKNAPEPLTVEFRLTSDSSRTWQGTLESLNYRGDIGDADKEDSVTVTVSIDEQELGTSLRLGSRVLGKIACGERNNFFLLTYEIRNRIREWFFW